MLFKESFRVIWSIMSIKCLPSCAMHSWSRKNDWRIFYLTTQMEQLWLRHNVLSTGQGNCTLQEYPCRLYAPCYQCMWYHVLEIFLRPPSLASCNVIFFMSLLEIKSLQEQTPWHLGVWRHQYSKDNCIYCDWYAWARCRTERTNSKTVPQEKSFGKN